MPNVTYSDRYPVGHHSPHACKGGADEVTMCIRSERDGKEWAKVEEIFRCGTCGEVSRAAIVTWEQVEFIRGTSLLELRDELNKVLRDPGEMAWHRYAYIEALRGALIARKGVTHANAQSRQTPVGRTAGPGRRP